MQTNYKHNLLPALADYLLLKYFHHLKLRILKSLQQEYSMYELVSLRIPNENTSHIMNYK
jgi:hypothetical protein